MSFKQALATGLQGESIITKWLNVRGFSVLPAYEVAENAFKGPRLFTPAGALISPDLLCLKKDKIIWIEAKTKSSFTWYRIKEQWQTGIDLRHWEEYQEVAKTTDIPVWLVFLHKPGGRAVDTPGGMVSPVGLFGNEIAFLVRTVDHTSKNHGRSGMVYWGIDSLKKIADVVENGCGVEIVASPP